MACKVATTCLPSTSLQLLAVACSSLQRVHLSSEVLSLLNVTNCSALRELHLPPRTGAARGARLKIKDQGTGFFWPDVLSRLQALSL